MLQERPQKGHQIPLEVDLTVGPSAWYNELPGRVKVATPIKAQLKLQLLYQP
jgi:hypothetical protein